MTVNKPELLAPAGDLECLNTSINFGADAIYCGGDFMQMRAEKVGFTREDLKKATEITHKAGKKLYVTVNCFAKNSEIEPLKEYAKFLYEIGADAAIVSDIGVLNVIKKTTPDLPVHISTQANCTNYQSANVYYNLGASRIVLARELSIEDIAVLRANTPKELELEAFVHGAMCMSYSGRCLISSFLNNRSGNRGECTQPCRWSYYLVEQKRPDEYFEIIEENQATAVLSSKDLNSITFLDKLTDAGITSFKIEGRMKTPFYVATAVNAYRRAIDGGDIAELNDELNCISHRPYSSGFYFGELINNTFNDGLYHSDAKFIGVVKSCENGIAKIEMRNAFFVGDILEIVSPHSLKKSIKVEKIFNSEGEETDRATLVQEIVSVPVTEDLYAGDFLRRRETCN